METVVHSVMSLMCNLLQGMQGGFERAVTSSRCHRRCVGVDCIGSHNAQCKQCFRVKGTYLCCRAMCDDSSYRGSTSMGGARAARSRSMGVVDVLASSPVLRCIMQDSVVPPWP